jgi:DNA-binding NarL/FixJ family response regulator
VPLPIRLILIDDHAVLRAGLANLLNFESDLTVIAEAGDGHAALQLWREHRPDVMLLDLSLNGMGGIETLRLLRAEFPEARVLMLTSSETQEDVRESLKAGACGYVTKTVLRGELVDSIREVHAGGQAFGEHFARVLAADSQRSCLSRRELEVLGLVRQGFTNSDIGRVLAISEHTAKAHVASLLVKLEAADRAEAVARGFERGLLKV